MKPRLDLLTNDQMSRLTFQELRDAMTMTDEGQVLLSFIAVEIGLDDFEACWDAHCDVYESITEKNGPEQETLISLFLHEIYDMLEIDGGYLERVLATNT